MFLFNLAEISTLKEQFEKIKTQYSIVEAQGSKLFESLLKMNNKSVRQDFT